MTTIAAIRKLIFAAVLSAPIFVGASSAPLQNPLADSVTDSAVHATSATAKAKTPTAKTTTGFYYSRYLQNQSLNSAPAAAGSFVLSRRSGFLHRTQTRVQDLLQQQLNNAPLRRQLLDAFLNPDTNVRQEWEDLIFQSGWTASEIVLQEVVKSATADAVRTGFIRNVGVDVRSELGRRFQHIGIDVLGAFHATEKEAFVWQLRGYTGKDSTKDDISGGNAGLIYRRANTNSMLGVNVFVDFQQQQIFKSGTTQNADFWRWSGGGEFRSPWLDVFGNYYDAITTPILQTVTVNGSVIRRHAFSAGGYDVEFNLHAPQYPWFALAASYFSWRGEFDAADDNGSRYGIKLSPRTFPAVLEVEYQASGAGQKQLGGSFAVHYEMGRDYANIKGIANSAHFRPQDYFFLPVQREYSQRIRYADGTAFNQAAWVIGERDVVGGAGNEVRIVRNARHGTTAQITISSRLGSNVSTTLNILENEILTVFATTRATLHYNLRYAINGTPLQSNGLGTAAVSGTIEFEYKNSGPGQAAAIVQHLRMLGGGEMLLIAGDSAGFAAITPDTTVRIISSGTTLSIRYVPAAISGEIGTTYITVYSGGVSVQTQNGGISHLCQGALGINEIERDGITLAVSCQFNSANHVQLANVAQYNAAAPSMQIGAQQRIVASLGQPTPEGSTPTVSFLLNVAAATIYINTTPVAQITYAGSGFQYRQTSGTRGLRINAAGQVFISLTIAATTRIYSQTLSLFFEVYNNLRAGIAPRTGSWEVVVRANRYQNNNQLQVQQLSDGASPTIYTVIVPLENGALPESATAASLVLNGGTGDYVIEVLSEQGEHFSGRNLSTALSGGGVGGVLQVRRNVGNQQLVSDREILLTVVLNDRGYLAEYTEPSTVAFTLSYIESLHNVRLIYTDANGAAVYQGLTPVWVFDGQGTASTWMCRAIKSPK